MDDEYETPILAQICSVCGAGMVLVTVLLVWSAYRITGEPQYYSAPVRPEIIKFVLFLPALFSALAALFLYGIGQVIDYIGQTAFYSARLVQVVATHVDMSITRNKDDHAVALATAKNTKVIADVLSGAEINRAASR